MPKVSLVVCLYKERSLLERLLSHCDGIYDDLVVIHDGPEEGPSPSTKSGTYEPGWQSPEQASISAPGAPTPLLSRDFSTIPAGGALPSGYRQLGNEYKPGSVHELAIRFGGRFFEGPRSFQQEPHWPFAWWAAQHNWILRLDADEYPSEPLREWLQDFRSLESVDAGISSYTCIWPLWNQREEEPQEWPDGRQFLFNKQRAKFFGMVEQVAIMEDPPTALKLVLNHRPVRKSHGYRNLLFRKQAYVWRMVIAKSLLKSPLTLPRWRWESPNWPISWSQLAEAPLLTALKRLIKFQVYFARTFIRHKRYDLLYTLPISGLHHALIGLNVFLIKLKIFR